MPVRIFPRQLSYKIELPKAFLPINLPKSHLGEQLATKVFRFGGLKSIPINENRRHRSRTHKR